MEFPALAIQGLKSLEFIIGHWKTEGATIATATSPATLISGTDTYEWILGGAFILHRVDVYMGEEKTEVIELIGFETADTTFSLRSFDKRGNFTLMQGRLMSEKEFKIEDKKMRSTLTINDSGDEMTAFWEQSEDGLTWFPWMDLKLTRHPEVVECKKEPLSFSKE